MKWFSRLKIRNKLVSGFLLVAMLAGAIGYTGITSLRKIDEADTILYEENTLPLHKLGVLAREFHRQRVNLLGLLIANTPDQKKYYMDRITTIAASFDKTIQEVAPSFDTDELQAKFDSFLTEREQFGAVRGKIVDLAMADQDTAAMTVFRSEAEQSAVDLGNTLDRLIDAKVEAARLQAEANTALANRTVTLMLLMMIGGVVLSVFIGVLIAGLIGAPVRQLSEAAERIASGDNEVTVTVKAQDELGSLAAVFNKMVQNIKSGLADVRRKGEEAERAAQEAEQARAEAQAQQEYLAHRVAAILREMEHFAEGDLTVHLEATRDAQHDADGSIFRLYEGFNKSVRNLRGMLVQVGEVAESTAGASAQISASTEQLASSSQEQSAQSQEVAVAVEQMVRTIVENARNASDTAEMAGQSGQAAREGGEVVMQTVAKIRQIASVVADSTATVEKLGASSRQIGEIVRVIDEIADQTNLLALNAAIEAARAGDQGRGFAVVADEVRKLAERTTTATKEIAQMIKTIQEETGQAVVSMQRGSQEVEEGIALADRAGVALRQIVDGAEHTVDRVSQIAAASEEQSTTSEQISRSVEMISTVTSESAQGIGQIAQAADGLTALTEQLRNLVGRFRTDAAPAEAFAPDLKKFRNEAPAPYSGDGGSKTLPVPDLMRRR